MILNNSQKRWLIWAGCFLLNSSYLIYIIRLSFIDEGLLGVTKSEIIEKSNKMFMILMSTGISMLTFVFSELKRNALSVTFLYFSGLAIVFIIDYFINFISDTKYPCYILSITSLLCLCYLASLLIRSHSKSE
jgi:magnesium-transporting ATPase (P-type)